MRVCHVTVTAGLPNLALRVRFSPPAPVNVSRKEKSMVEKKVLEPEQKFWLTFWSIIVSFILIFMIGIMTYNYVTRQQKIDAGYVWEPVTHEYSESEWVYKGK